MNKVDPRSKRAISINSNIGAAADVASMASLMTFPGYGKNPHYHAFCQGCCHPVAACCCGAPRCRKEPKELLAVPSDGKKATGNNLVLLKTMENFASLARSVSMASDEEAAEKAKEGGKMRASIAAALDGIEVKAASGQESAFIGGGCCVHLSIEYMPQNFLSSQNCSVMVYVVDSEGTILLWGKVAGAQSGYHIEEDIISTKPGAKLMVHVTNMIARVRWCEVFSC